MFYLGIFKVNLNPWHGKNEPPISAHRGSGYWAIELCAILEPLEGVQIGAISQLEQAIEVNRLAHYHIWWNLDLADDDGGRILEVADTLVVATLGFWNWIGSKRIWKNSLFARINHWFPPIISNICLLESFQMIHSGFPKNVQISDIYFRIRKIGGSMVPKTHLRKRLRLLFCEMGSWCFSSSVALITKKKLFIIL